MDLSVLAVTLPTMDIDGDSFPTSMLHDEDYVGYIHRCHFGYSIHGAVEPMVTSSFLSVPMGGLARGLEASPDIRPSIRAGLASQGILPGTADYELFFTAFQTVIDSMDPINWSAEAARLRNIVLHEVIGDTVLSELRTHRPVIGYRTDDCRNGSDPVLHDTGRTRKA